MKNRKLFAIITLVAFMLTMMPMMAFATITGGGSSIAVDDASAQVVKFAQITDDQDAHYEDFTAKVDYLDFVIDLDDAIGASTVYAFVERNGALSDVDYIYTVKPNVQTIEAAYYDDLAAAKTAVFGASPVAGYLKLEGLSAGENHLYILSEKAGTVKVSVFVVKGTLSGATPEAKAIEAYNGSSDVIRTAFVGNGATGKFNASGNVITIAPVVTRETGSAAATGTPGIDGLTVYQGATANNGVTYYKVVAAVTKGGSKLVGEEVTVSADKTGVSLSETELTTSATGKVDFKVSAKKPGTYTISITCGNETQEFKVKFAATGAAEAEFSSTVADTIAVDATENKAMKLKVTDANGNVMAANGSTAEEGLFEVEVIAAPAESALEDEILTIADDGDDIYVSFTPDAAGEYTIRVINTTTGVADTTTIKAAEFGTIAGATISYPSSVYLLGSSTPGATVKVVDQNGVKKAASTKTFSYAGVGATINTTTGALTFSNDDKYAGNEIVVSVVANGKYAASTTLTIANEPAQLVFADATAAVGQEVAVNFNVVDIEGKVTAIAAQGTGATLVDVDVQNALVIERPAGAIVSVNADALGNDGTAEKDLIQKGKGSIKVVSDKEGVVKVNVILAVDKGNTGTPDFYLAGVATVNVGGVVVDETETSTVTLIIGSTTFVANGKAEVAPVAPAVVDGRTLVPVRAFAQATGAEVVYDANTKVITITAEGLLAQMTVGSNILTVNGQTTVMDSAATLIDGSTVLPVRYAGQALGYGFECAYGVDGAVTSVTMFK